MIDAELRQYLEQLRQENAAEFAAVHQEMRSGFDDMRRHFDAVIERLDGKTDLIVDMVLNVDQKLDREAASIGAEMRDGFADTQNLIRYIAPS